MFMDRRAPPQTASQTNDSVANAPVLSSSPAFATPAHPIRPPPPPPRQYREQRLASNSLDASTPPPPSTRVAPILPIILPPATLRPIAFRTFTKKHNLTLTSSALQALASFIGRHCGAAWREEGLAEMVLEEVARSWKKGDGRVIVDASSNDQGEKLRQILKAVEGSMVGGRLLGGNRGSSGPSEGGKPDFSRQGSLLEGVLGGLCVSRPGVKRNESQESFGMSALDVDAEGEVEEEEESLREPRASLKVVGAFDQPRLMFNPSRKQFEKSTSKPSFFPPPSHKTELFRQKYHLIHQRLLRNESFQTPTSFGHGTSKPQQPWKVTPIANLLGRSGSGHLLLGLLTIAPTGTLALSDLTGSVGLNLEQATPIDETETWLCPGMILLVDGIYEEEYNATSGSLEGVGGVGGTIGGRFIGFAIGAPRCETRATSLGLLDLDGSGDVGVTGGGFGWVDFLGVGSERALGSKMRRLERQLLAEKRKNKIVLLGEVNLDDPRTLIATRKLFSQYSSGAPDNLSILPLAFVLFGSFSTYATLSSPSTSSASHDGAGANTTDTSSIAYKEHLDAFATLLSEFPLLLRNCSFIFVPGDNDPWASSFSAGAACPLPKRGIPDVFTSRVRRVFTTANVDTTMPKGARKVPGEAIWTSNPSRLTLFGPNQEIVLFRDDLSGRMRRNSVPIKGPAQENGEEADVRPPPDVPGGNSVMSRGRDGVSISSNAFPLAQQGDQAPNPDTQDAMDVDSPAPPQRVSDQGAPDPTTTHARRVTKTLLDQSHLSPFPLSVRPLHWSYASSPLTLYPLPSAIVLCDTDAEAWSLVYQGCAVMNVGGFVQESRAAVKDIRGDDKEGKALTGAKRATMRTAPSGGKKGSCRWVEYDVSLRRGVVREMDLP